jgi:hypothetical protein
MEDLAPTSRDQIKPSAAPTRNLKWGFASLTTLGLSVASWKGIGIGLQSGFLDDGFHGMGTVLYASLPIGIGCCGFVMGALGLAMDRPRALSILGLLGNGVAVVLQVLDFGAFSSPWSQILP